MDACPRGGAGANEVRRLTLLVLNSCALDFDPAILLPGQIKPQCLVVYVGDDVDTLFPSFLAVVGFSRFDFGMILAVAAALIFVFACTHVIDFEGVLALIGDAEFDLMQRCFLGEGSCFILIGWIEPPYTISLFF